MREAVNVSHLVIFQSTLLQEERRVSNYSKRIIQYFNPRSYKRSDEEFLEYLQHKNISIHAPTRGATIPLKYSRYDFIISIHAPTRGATL